jgi:two-component system nitrogen regulation response regulator GlnG
VMVLGESGTGKSLIARAIHDFSDRRSQPYVVIHASDLAGVDGIGSVLAKAKGGSLVLDEVSDYDDESQAKLARMLDVMGEHAPRILATSQNNLSARMEAGKFRADLYYRLGGVTIDVPPLRERVEDIPLLAEHFLAKGERENGVQRRLSPEALQLLRGHTWPGNVRQLENILRRLLVTATEPEITREELEFALGSAPVSPSHRANSTEIEKLSTSVLRHLQRYFDLHAGQLPPAGVYDRILREIEVPMIEIALDATGGNQAKCADLLGINRNTLRKKITDLDIQVTRRRKLM